MTSSLLKTEGLVKSYPEGGKLTCVLDQVSFELEAGKTMCLTGPSGSGKSTLLQIVGLLDRQSSGDLFFGDDKANEWKRSKRENFRATSIGFVFQKHLLLPEFTLLENVALPLARTQGWKKEVYEKAENLLQKMGILERKKAYPKQLSGGEMQRGAICRAMIHNPKLILMDEPTGNLDPTIGEQVMRDVFTWIKEEGASCILVTHNLELTRLTDIHYRINQHKLEVA